MRPSPRRRRWAPGDCRQGALPLPAGFALAGYEVQYDVDRLHDVVFEADCQRMLHPLHTAVPDDRTGSVVRFKGMRVHEESANIAFLPGGDFDLGDRHSSDLLDREPRDMLSMPVVLKRRGLDGKTRRSGLMPIGCLILQLLLHDSYLLFGGGPVACLSAASAERLASPACRQAMKAPTPATTALATAIQSPVFTIE